MRFPMLFATLALVPASAHADWTAANPEVAQAAKIPRIASALDAVNRIDTAIMAGDKAGFIGAFADDAVVNSPFNTVNGRAEAERRYQSGMITVKNLHRSIEYAASRRDDEVVLMGEESYQPPAGAPMAGKTVHRRFTDLWRMIDGKWRLSVRQATIFRAE